MVINPKEVVDRNWVFSNSLPIEVSEQIQQNGVDLRINKLYSLEGELVLRKTKERSLPKRMEILPGESCFFKEGWLLRKLNPYIVEMVEEVSIPEKACAIVYMRSTLNRSGIPLFGCLFDSGYRGIATFTIYPFADVSIERHARIAQIVFLPANAASLYNGFYQMDN